MNPLDSVSKDLTKIIDAITRVGEAIAKAFLESGATKWK